MKWTSAFIFKQAEAKMLPVLKPEHWVEQKSKLQTRMIIINHLLMATRSTCPEHSVHQGLASLILANRLCSLYNRLSRSTSKVIKYQHKSLVSLGWEGSVHLVLEHTSSLWMSSWASQCSWLWVGKIPPWKRELRLETRNLMFPKPWVYSLALLHFLLRETKENNSMSWLN